MGSTNRVLVVYGNNPTVKGNRLSNCANGGTFKIVSVTGDDAVVSLNQILGCSSGMDIVGLNVQVTLNKISNSQRIQFDQSIVITGDGLLADKNTLSHSGGITAFGDNVTVRSNSITVAINDASGVIVSSRTSAGGGLIEANKIKNAIQRGVALSGNNVTIRRNNVNGAGTEGNEGCYYIFGSTNTVTDNVATSAGTHGFYVSGTSNVLLRCSATGSAADGFNINGTGNSLTGCSAKLCTGEGLDNGGTDTTVTGCTFLHNRLDVANDGTFSNVATFNTDNTFVTGGTAQPPQVD
jgi:hypothetical protein